MGTSQYVMIGSFGAGLIGVILAIFWKGIGEVIGGLVNVGLGGLIFVALASEGIPSFNAENVLVGLVLALPVVVVGALYIACGWIALAQRARHAPALPA